MHRIDADAHVGNLFDEGDPGVPVAPTQVDADWLNAVQEELANAIEDLTAGGITLIKGTNNQLATAMVSRATVQIITAAKTFQAGIVATQSAANSVAISAAGNGTGAGVSATGGDTSANGVNGTGGAPNGSGVRGVGTGVGFGVVGQGGATGSGVVGSGGATSGVGVTGNGGPGSAGLTGQGGANGAGCVAVGDGTGTGAQFTGGGTGYGLIVQADTTSPVRAALRIVPQDLPPSSPQLGDLYVETSTGFLMIYNAGGSWVKVGAQ